MQAPAKINLYLHITGKRPDGYHLLDSLAVFAEFGDKLEFEPAEKLSLAMYGSQAENLAGDIKDNLIIKAARLLHSHTGCGAGARIALHKHIPVGAGLGGGSSDAAATLKGLVKLWNLSIDDAALYQMAAQLGSDVPVCLGQQAARMEGVGEIVTPVDGPEGWLLLVNPNIHLTTAAVFHHFNGPFSEPAIWPEQFDDIRQSAKFLSSCHNALQDTAMMLVPSIAQILTEIEETPGCLLARMTGSGATCFGLYEHANEAMLAEQELAKEHPTWWCKATAIKGTHGKTQ